MKLIKVTVGLGTCGRASGGIETYDELVRSDYFRNNNILLEKTACLGACFYEPIVEVRFEEKSYFFKHITKDKIDIVLSGIKSPELIDTSCLIDFSVPYFTLQNKMVTKNIGRINPYSIEEFEKNGELDALKKALNLSPREVVDVVKKSGLRGRGGAGFPTGVKWEMLASKTGQKYLVCNADSGDPGSFMNRSLLEGDPFRVLTGMIIAGYATGANHGYIYCREEYPLAREVLAEGIKSLRQKGYLGTNILNKGFDFDIEIKRGAGAFVCGEETALMNSIMGYRGMPNPRPPYPVESGIFGRPTNINNVSTYGTVTTIFEIGVDNFVKVGTVKTKGTAIICLTGAVKYPGVVEVDFGTPLRTVVERIGEANNFKAVLTGGPSGGCIPKSLIDTPIDFETFAELGSIVGSGGMVFLDENTNLVDTAHFFLSFTKMESCGKCTPCREGNVRLFEILDRISHFQAEDSDIELLQDLANFIKDSSLCGLGQTAPNPVLSTLKYFRSDYDHFMKPQFRFYFITDKCVGCHACSIACPTKCIVGEVKEKHMIEQEKCIGCGSCYRVCKFNAIVKHPSLVQKDKDKKKFKHE